MKSGSEVAEGRLERLYRDERRSLLSLAYLLLGDRGAAEDVVHDAFAGVGARLDVIDNPAAYLRTTVVNATRRWHRRYATEARWRADVSANEAVPFAGSADAIAVRRVLADLPDEQREAIVLRYFADLSFREIGEMLECPTQTVATRVRRGLDRVRAALEERP